MLDFAERQESGHAIHGFGSYLRNLLRLQCSHGFEY